MKETIDLAKEEIKRADHLLYVSLKYTKTVDVIKSLLDRIAAAYEISIESLLLYMQDKNKIKEIPGNPIMKADEIKILFKDNPEFVADVDHYLLLRKINRAEFTRAREFRRHVTMTVTVDEQVIEVNIDVLYEYYDRVKNFVENAYKLIHGIKDD